MMSKRSFRLKAIFSALVFLILTLTMALTSVIALVLYYLGAFANPARGWAFAAFALASIIVGTILSGIVGNRHLHMIQDVDDASKEVVKGNFSVRLNENVPVRELRSMARNFNIMVRELSNTEIFRTDFIENVSHEFKTPLSAIEGYATLLQNKSLSPEKREEYTQRILLNTRRLSSLTGNILLLSQLENQEMEIQKETFSLDEQLREAILLYENQWTEKNLDLDIDLCTADYTGNRELLMQVWQNILGNAMKFVPQGGRIRVLLRQEGNRLEAAIVDNGAGMSPEVQQRVFEKFYQADRSRNGIGNGLGLALAKRIVDLHGGTIQVHSTPGRGTAFAVTLPL